MDDLFFIDKVLNGDTDAFSYFVSTYKDMAFTIAISISKDEFTAQEIAQDAFVKAFLSLHRFSRKSKFKTWFYRIVVNEALAKMRTSKKEFLSFQSHQQEDILDETILENIQDKEQARLINQALQQLSPNESLALRLFYLQEESIKEVSEITGWSEANTKVILHRARKNISGILKKLIKQTL